MDEQAAGVVFPETADGRRSTSALGRAVVTDALRAVDEAGALAAERETNWRSGYVRHFRRLTVAGLPSREAALAIARDGLASLHGRMRTVDREGVEREIGTLVAAAPSREVATVTVDGSAEPEAELVVPYRGQRLRGDALLRQLEAWVARGVVEPSCAEAVAQVIANPDWLALPGRTVAVLGAGAEVGPLAPLLRWGATVAAVDLPRAGVWQRILRAGRRGAGTLLVPVRSPAPGRLGAGGDDGLAERAGLDLLAGATAAADWVAASERVPVLANSVYADGGLHVRVAVAVDVLTLRLLAARDDAALAFLATPTDVFAVPPGAVEHATRAYEQRSTVAKLAGRPLRTVSGGRLLRRNYVPGVDPGLCDALVPQQGPNYALAKRLQRWRAATARAAGVTVSCNVAPSTRTRSVVKNRALAAAFAGAHRFGIEVFDPPTTNTLMAALLVHDLHTGGGPPHDHPWQDEAHAAAHGGLWRAAYAPRSALGLATLLGLGAARG